MEKAAVISEGDFRHAVIEASRRRYVLVDFWAPWCAPCRTLTPTLERVAGEYAGKLVLVKVNTDEAQRLAGAYGIRSLPTVKLFHDGAVVDEFFGARPEAAVRAFLNRHLPRESDEALELARRAREKGENERAVRLLHKALKSDPANERIPLALAHALLEDDGRFEEAAEVLGSLPAQRLGTTEGRALLARVEIARAAHQAPAQEVLQRTLAEDPGDCEARYRLAMLEAARGEHQAALDQLLEIMRRNRTFRDDAGRKGLLLVFDVLGGRGPLVSRYRSLMASALH